jgi:hypothetical protein
MELNQQALEAVFNYWISIKYPECPELTKAIEIYPQAAKAEQPDTLVERLIKLQTYKLSPTHPEILVERDKAIAIVRQHQAEPMCKKR